VAGDLGNTALGNNPRQWQKGENKTGNVLIPPFKELHRCFLALRRYVSLEKVDDEFIELLIAEPVVMAHPMRGIREIEVQLEEV